MSDPVIVSARPELPEEHLLPAPHKKRHTLSMIYVLILLAFMGGAFYVLQQQTQPAPPSEQATEINLPYNPDFTASDSADATLSGIVNEAIRQTVTPANTTTTPIVPTSTPTPTPTYPTPTPTPTRYPNPPQMGISYPKDGQSITMNSSQTFCVVDYPQGGDTSSIMRKHNSNSGGWTPYVSVYTLCYEPAQGANTIQLQYRNGYGEESVVYTRSFTFTRQ